MNDEDLSGPASTRVFSEARSTIGWLARHFVTATFHEVAVYFHRTPSTFSRHIAKSMTVCAVVKRGILKLNQCINAGLIHFILGAGQLDFRTLNQIANDNLGTSS